MSFFARVYAAAKKIPRGRIATYGQLAALVGSPRAAQAVGWALAVCDPAVVPWQRVVAKNGWLTIINDHLSADLQAALLRREGLKVEQEDGRWRVQDFEEKIWKTK